jgi:hypothetical protein
MEEPTNEPRRRRGGTRFVIGTGGIGGSGDPGSGSPAPPESASENESATWSNSEAPVSRVTRRKKTDIAAAKGAADLIIGTMETLAYARYRTHESRMTKDEREMTLTGLSKSVEVLPADVVKQVSSLSAPVMACMGLALYFLRLGEMEQRLRANRKDQTTSQRAEEYLASYPADPQTVTENGTYVPPKSMVQDLMEGI